MERRKAPFRWLLVFSVLTILICQSAFATDYRSNRCKNRKGGEFDFGEGGVGCDVSAYKEIPDVMFNYASFVFNRAEETEVQRKEYVTSMVGLIADLARFYIDQRKPNASEQEKKAWVRAILAKGNQETYLSHYRIERDGNIKLTTGDSLYSYGIMQIHRRWHKIQGTDIGVDLVENILYGLDHFYDYWEGSKSKSCVRGREGNSDYFKRRARSAYSAYNGGPGSYCRWTNSGARWAQNDRGYHQKWKDQLWLRHAESHQDDSKSPVDINCLMNDEGNCDKSVNYDAYYDGDKYLLASGETCYRTGEAELSCFQDSRMRSCFKASEGLPEEKKGFVEFEKSDDMIIKTFTNRDLICHNAFPSLIKRHSFIKLNKSINVRATPGGNLVTGTTAGDIYQVLDFDFKNDGSGGRYYLIKVNGKYGYIYAGDIEDHLEWAEEVEANEDSNYVFPSKGQVAEVVKEEGTKLLRSPHEDSEVVTTAETGETFKVYAVRVIGEESLVYLLVQHDGRMSYLYAGRMNPSVTTDSWVKISE